MFDAKAHWTGHADAFCDEEGRREYGSHHRLLFSWLQDLRPRRVALIGIGFGRELMKLRHYGEDLLAIDISAPMIAKARTAVPEATYVEADVADIPLPDNDMDVAITFACLTHVPPEKIDQSVSEVFRVGRTGILVEPHWDGDPTGIWRGDVTDTWRHPYPAVMARLGIALDGWAIGIAHEKDGSGQYAVIEGHRP